MYYCFEPEYFTDWSSQFKPYAVQHNLKNLAEWLKFNESYSTTSTLNTTRLDDDQWASISCKGSGAHTITFTVTTNTTGASDDDYNRGWDGFTFELFQKSGTSYSLVSSFSPTTGSVNTEVQYLCPTYIYAVTITEPMVVTDDLPVVVWTITDTYSATVATGEGVVSQCEFYGSYDLGKPCNSYPTFYPTPQPTSPAATAFVEDYFSSTSVGSIWEAACDLCTFSSSGVTILGTDFLRTAGTGIVRTIEVLVKFRRGDNPFIVLSSDSEYSWNDDFEEGAVKIGIEDSTKLIKGQSKKSSCSCDIPDDVEVSWTIRMYSNSISFYDNTCSGISNDKDGDDDDGDDRGY